MIDKDGFRANVGIILCNDQKQVFWAHRIGHIDSWQFPQGGINQDETPLEAMYRELKEEIGLDPNDVEVIGHTNGWLKYRLPLRLIRKNPEQKMSCIGQKQIWFMLRYRGKNEQIDFNTTDTPEFDHWRWTEYWLPIMEVVRFKKEVYSKALKELAPLLFGDHLPSFPDVSANKYRNQMASLPRPLYRIGLRKLKGLRKLS